MQFDKLKLILLIGCLALPVYQVESLQACGADLYVILTNFCEMNSMGTGISALNTINDNFEYQEFEQQPLLRDLIGGRVNRAVKIRRRRSDIHQLCCHNTCSYEDLRPYCANH